MARIFLHILTGCFLFGVLGGCSSMAIKPADVEVKVSREAPSNGCKDLGPVIGTTGTAHGTEDEALKDLKTDAARKGANYVQIETFSAYGTAAKGTAFYCP